MSSRKSDEKIASTIRGRKKVGFIAQIPLEGVDISKVHNKTLILAVVEVKMYGKDPL